MDFRICKALNFSTWMWHVFPTDFKISHVNYVKCPKQISVLEGKNVSSKTCSQIRTWSSVGTQQICVKWSGICEHSLDSTQCHTQVHYVIGHVWFLFQGWEDSYWALAYGHRRDKWWQRHSRRCQVPWGGPYRTAMCTGMCSRSAMPPPFYDCDLGHISGYVLSISKCWSNDLQFYMLTPPCMCISETWWDDILPDVTWTPRSSAEPHSGAVRPWVHYLNSIIPASAEFVVCHLFSFKLISLHYKSQ
jgi:hypothetical protein